MLDVDNDHFDGLNASETCRVFNEDFQVYGVRKVWLMRMMVFKVSFVASHCIGQVCPVSPRPLQPTLQGSRAEHAVVSRFHLCRDLAGLRLLGLVIDAFAHRIVG